MFDVLIGVREVAVICSGDDDISTEAGSRSRTRRQHAVSTRRLVPVTVSAPVFVTCGSRERIQELLEEAFDIGMSDVK